MSLKLHIFNELAPGVQHEVATRVSDYTNGRLGEQPQMLPIEPDAIWQKSMGVVAFDSKDFAGYIGATTAESHEGVLMPEVGSLWVPTEHRKKGIAHQLIRVISTSLKAEDQWPYAFCNPLSKGIFEQSGYQIVESGAVPASAFNLCGGCRHQPVGGGCCDKVLIFKGDNS